MYVHGCMSIEAFELASAIDKRCQAVSNIIADAYNLEGAKDAYCRVCSMYIHMYIYLFIFIAMSGFTVQSAIIYGINLFATPRMQCMLHVI